MVSWVLAHPLEPSGLEPPRPRLANDLLSQVAENSGSLLRDPARAKPPAQRRGGGSARSGEGARSAPRKQPFGVVGRSPARAEPSAPPPRCTRLGAIERSRGEGRPIWDARGPHAPRLARRAAAQGHRPGRSGRAPAGSLEVGLRDPDAVDRLPACSSPGRRPPRSTGESSLSSPTDARTPKPSSASATTRCAARASPGTSSSRCAISPTRSRTAPSPRSRRWAG